MFGFEEGGSEIAGAVLEAVGHALGGGAMERRSDVDLGDAQFDGGGEVVAVQSAGSVEDEGDVDGVADCVQAIDLEAADGGGSVGVADGDSEPVDVGLADESGGFVGVGPAGVADGDACFIAGDVSELGFEREGGPLDECFGLADDGEVLIEGEGGAVDHDGVEAGVDGQRQFVEGVGVVEVEGGVCVEVFGEALDDCGAGVDAADQLES